MAMLAGMGNRDQAEKVGGRSSRIRAAPTSDTWTLPSTLHEQLVTHPANGSLSFYRVLEYLASSDPNAPQTPTLIQYIGWSTALIELNQSRFEKYKSFAERMDYAFLLITFWLSGLCCTRFVEGSTLSTVDEVVEAYNSIMKKFVMKATGYANETAYNEAKETGNTETDEGNPPPGLSKGNEDTTKIEDLGINIQVPMQAGTTNFELNHEEVYYQEALSYFASRIECAVGLSARGVDYFFATGSLESLWYGTSGKTPIELTMGKISAAVSGAFKTVCENFNKPDVLGAARITALKVIKPLFRSVLKVPPPSDPDVCKYKLVSGFCSRACFGLYVLKSAGLPVDAIRVNRTAIAPIGLLTPLYKTDEGLAPKALSGVCLGDLGKAFDSTPAEVQRGAATYLTINSATSNDRSDIAHVFLGGSKSSKRDFLIFEAIDLAFTRNLLGFLEPSALAVATESTERLRSNSLGFSAIGWALSVPKPNIRTTSTALVAAARELAAVQQSEFASSPIALSVIFADKSTQAKLKPSESVINALARGKKRIASMAITARVSISDIESGKAKEVQEAEMEKRKQGGLKRALADLGVSLNAVNDFRDKMAVTKEHKRKVDANNQYFLANPTGTLADAPYPKLLSEQELLQAQAEEMRNARTFFFAMRRGISGNPGPEEDDREAIMVD